MNPEILKLQEKAVNSLISMWKSKDIITFKSPTGSGKTIMICDFMEKIISEDNDAIFLVSSLSKSELAEQNHESFLNKSITSPIIKPFLIKSETPEERGLKIPFQFNIYSLPIALFKEKSKLFQGIFTNFLKEMIKKGKKLYLIKDEAHIETKHIDNISNFFDKILNVSATPKTTKMHIDVEITEQEALSVNLIKSKKIMGTGELDELDDALEQFIKVKKEYNKILNINPCLLIQISNEEKGLQELGLILKKIENKKEKLKWMYMASDIRDYDTNDIAIKISNKNKKRKWKEYAKSNESLVDIIISKMVITEGWDIPRACMLFQIRDTESKTLTEQMIGRVRRNPILNKWNSPYIPNEARELAMTAWIWGDINDYNRGFTRVKNNSNIIVKTTELLGMKQVYENANFNPKQYLINEFKIIENNDNIFDLAKKWKTLTIDEYNTYWEYVENINDWVNFTYAIDKIKTENHRLVEEYDKTMTIATEEKFSIESYFENTNINLEIDNWIWKIVESNSNEYHFDSNAEKKFARFLRDLRLNTWGKNFYPNSKIKFQYIDDTLKASYPDFILKDFSNTVHIFEVKSINESNHFNFNSEEYKRKIQALRRAYKYCSKITKQNFYIPVLIGSNWRIYTFIDGIEDEKNLDELKKIITT
ncbi:DEAD/DEAH box helicase [Williamsoniiplasma luminosum]|uniref:Helicase/UvrB N-terminal domain-containing protein n=1 Tax=Williamsoniiplasma luminosum TaxID=214888 RepID=A0A2S0NJ11_9MOLU|nr:DEAD/DEAH box helicase family protein [Williamsoniiplasma luminosum]AVP49000.1 MAG: hypothetical protein C5T88_00130 [Williamsoniiplasma luminosum]